MDKIFNPGKYGMVFCPDCTGKDKLPKNPGGSNICPRCGGSGLDKEEKEVSQEDKKTN